MGVSTNTQVTGGIGAFTVVFLLALAVWFLGRSMTRRLRRLEYRERDRLEALARERGQQAPGTTAGEPRRP